MSEESSEISSEQTPRYQIVVISISPERKAYLEKQFETLKLKDRVRIHYIRPATIENSQSYFPEDRTGLNLPVICCARSHLFCLEFACLSSAPEFTLILEDDVVFHKTQFVNAVEELIERWDEVVAPRKIASLGWVPVETPEWYSKLRLFHSMRCLHGSGVTYIMNPGLQAYLVRKQDIRPILPSLLYPKYEELHQYIEKYKQEKNDTYINSQAIDYYLTVLLGQAIVYPPVAIERRCPSALSHDNWHYYWNQFFKGREKRLDDYLLELGDSD